MQVPQLEFSKELKTYLTVVTLVNWIFVKMTIFLFIWGSSWTAIGTLALGSGLQRINIEVALQILTKNLLGKLSMNNETRRHI